MGRMITAIIIFATSILICVTNFLILSNSISELKDDIQTIETHVHNNDMNAAIYENKNLEEKFKHKYSYMSTFIHHDQLEDIADSISLMSVSLENDSKEDFFMESTKATSGLDHLNDTELPSIGNIL